MTSTPIDILTVNGGSSGIKFALYEAGESLTLLFAGEIEFGDKIGNINMYDAITGQKTSTDFTLTNRQNIAEILISYLEKQDRFHAVNLIGHRVVHGMRHTAPQLISDELLIDLKNISAYDPEHLPGEIKLIEALAKRFPAIPQVACFDTAMGMSRMW